MLNREELKALSNCGDTSCDDCLLANKEEQMDMCSAVEIREEAGKTALALLEENEQLKQEIEQYEVFTKGLESSFALLISRMNQINNIAVEWHGCGPYEDAYSEALNKMMEIEQLSRLRKEAFEVIEDVQKEIEKRDKALKLAREALKSIKNIGGGEPYSSNRAEVALTAINEALGGNE